VPPTSITSPSITPGAIWFAGSRPWATESRSKPPERGCFRGSDSCGGPDAATCAPKGATAAQVALVKQEPPASEPAPPHPPRCVWGRARPLYAMLSGFEDQREARVLTTDRIFSAWPAALAIRWRITRNSDSTVLLLLRRGDAQARRLML